MWGFFWWYENSRVFLDIYFSTCLRSNLLLYNARGDSRLSPYGSNCFPNSPEFWKQKRSSLTNAAWLRWNERSMLKIRKESKRTTSYVPSVTAIVLELARPRGWFRPDGLAMGPWGWNAKNVWRRQPGASENFYRYQDVSTIPNKVAVAMLTAIASSESKYRFCYT